MKLTSLLHNALAAALFILPSLAQAHPGHSAFDPAAGAPHAGHASEWASLLLFVVLTGSLLGMRWLESRRRRD